MSKKAFPEDLTESDKLITLYDGEDEEKAQAVPAAEPFVSAEFVEATVNHSALEDTWMEQQEREYKRVISMLDAALNKSLVKQREGYGRNDDGSKKMLDYLEWHTIVRQLNRIFGVGNWETSDLAITEYADPEFVVPAAVRATMTLTVSIPGRGRAQFVNVGFEVVKRKAIYENDHRTGEYAPPTWEAFEMAVKGAVHDCLKRDATALGEQFGLGLYPESETTSDVESTAATASRRTTSRTAAKTSEEAETDEVAQCESCGKEIRGYTNRQTGRVYTTADLVAMSKRYSKGHVLCYECRQANR